MEIYKLKTELDSLQMTNNSLKETISTKENDIKLFHERIVDVRSTNHSISSSGFLVLV